MSPGGSTRLGGLYVEFTEKGAALVKAAEDSLREGMDLTQRSLAVVGQAFNATFGAVTAQLESFVRQGVMASGAGDILNLQFAEIAHQIGSLFVPEIEKLIDGLSSVIQWFRNLDGEGQAHVAFWGKILLGTSATLAVLPKVVAAFNAIRSAWVVLNAAFVAAPMMLVITGLAVIVAAVVKAFGGWGEAFKAAESSLRSLADVFKDIFSILVSIVQGLAEWIKSVVEGIDEIVNKIPGAKEKQEESGGRSWLGKAWDVATTSLPIRALRALTGTEEKEEHLRRLTPEEQEEQDRKRQRKDLPPRLGGFESLEGTYRRIAAATVKATAMGGKSVPEKQLDVQEEIKRLMEQFPTLAAFFRPRVVGGD